MYVQVGARVRMRRWVALNFPVACVRHNRPVRCMLDRDEDMATTGSRHPFIGKYKVYERFLQCISVACYAERCISYDRFSSSDRQTVCHTLVSCQNDSSCDHAVFTVG